MDQNIPMDNNGAIENCDKNSSYVLKRKRYMGPLFLHSYRLFNNGIPITVYSALKLVRSARS